VDVVGGGEDVDVETGVDEVEGTLGAENGDEIGGGGRGNSKISTTFEAPLLLFPPAKNILF
jgi:hypothetical protein